MKKGQVSIFILVGVIIVAVLVLFGWLSSRQGSEVEVRDCATAADCVPAECCDADLCVPVSEAVDCSGVTCPLGCENYKDNSTGCDNAFTPESEKGWCDCVERKCVPVWP